MLWYFSLLLTLTVCLSVLREVFFFNFLYAFHYWELLPSVWILLSVWLSGRNTKKAGFSVFYIILFISLSKHPNSLKSIRIVPERSVYAKCLSLWKKMRFDLHFKMFKMAHVLRSSVHVVYVRWHEIQWGPVWILSWASFLQFSVQQICIKCHHVTFATLCWLLNLHERK